MTTMLEWVWGEDEEEEGDETNLQILATKVEAINRQLEEGNTSSEHADYKRILELQEEIVDKLDASEQTPVENQLAELKKITTALLILHNEIADQIAEQQETFENRLQNIERKLE